MKKLFKVLGILLVITLVVVGILFGIGKFQKRGAGISVETTPASTVFINGEQVGRTPYQGTRDPDEIVLKLVPDSFEKPLVPFETKVNLTSNVQTVVRREFGETEDLSSGVVVSFEKVSGSDTSLAIVSIPDAAQIALDGAVRGFAPYKTSSVSKGEHKLTVRAQGFAERSLSVRVVDGYKLTAIFKLAPTGDTVSETPTPDPSATPSGTPSPSQEVQILETGTGFLRVREKPTTGGAEVGQVTPGKRYPFVERDTATGWFKIEYASGKEGWVTNEFAKLVTSTPTPTPKATATPKASSSVKPSSTATPKATATP